MAGELYILSPHPDAQGQMSIRGDEARHLGVVHRARAGFRFIAFDGRGNGWLAAVASVSRDGLTAEVIETLTPEARVEPTLTVAMGVVKRPRMDWAVEKASELGAVGFIPLLTEFGVVKPGGSKAHRWVHLALEAAKQSRRLTLMRIEAALTLDELLKREEGIVAFDPTGVQPKEARIESHPKALTLLIGPEGGFSPGELEQIRERAQAVISMGTHPLRTETAVVAAMTVISQLVD